MCTAWCGWVTMRRERYGRFASRCVLGHTQAVVVSGNADWPSSRLSWLSYQPILLPTGPVPTDTIANRFHYQPNFCPKHYNLCCYVCILLLCDIVLHLVALRVFKMFLKKFPEDGLPVTSGVLVRVALHPAALLEDIATWGWWEWVEPAPGRPSYHLTIPTIASTHVNNSVISFVEDVGHTGLDPQDQTMV